VGAAVAAVGTGGGRIEAVCIGADKGARKQPVSAIELTTGVGIAGDAHAGSGHRQVSLLSGESIDRMRTQIPDLAHGDFAENIVVRGVSLDGVAVGDRFLAGQGILLEVTQIGKECHDACNIQQITGDCLMPREGVFCRVLAGGRLAPGDSIRRLTE
jgi:MOSC domain-containing protein YiiM